MQVSSLSYFFSLKSDVRFAARSTVRRAICDHFFAPFQTAVILFLQPGWEASTLGGHAEGSGGKSGLGRECGSGKWEDSGKHP